MSLAALWAWLAALPWKTAGAALATLLWERFLGRTPSTPASNTIDLIIHLWQHRRWGPPVPVTKTEDHKTMSNNPNARTVNVDVDGPTTDLLSAIIDVVTKVASGAKPADVASQELPQLFTLMNELGQIPADLKADPATVENAIALGLAKLGEAIRAHLNAPTIAKPVPAPGK